MENRIKLNYFPLRSIVVPMGVYESGASGKMGTRHVLQRNLSQQEEKKIPR